MKLGSEVHQLHPLSHQADEPNTRKAFARAIALMSETGDFRNLGPMLEGLKTARRSVKGWQMRKAVRAAMGAGSWGVVGECLRRVEETGIGLWEGGVMREVLWGVIGRGCAAGWQDKGFRGESARFLEHVWELCWDERHVGRNGGLGHPRGEPDVLGGMMLVFAVKGDRERVERFGGTMVRRWEDGELGVREGDWYDANEKLMMWAPVLAGMRIGSGVLGGGSALGGRMREMMVGEVRPVVEKCLEMVKEGAPQGEKRRGVKMYEDLARL